MRGHILLGDSDIITAMEKLIKLLSKGGKVTLKTAKQVFLPIKWQAALREQHGIMRKMEEYGLNRDEIAKILGYNRHLVDEILALEWGNEYDYSQFMAMRSFSDYDMITM